MARVRSIFAAMKKAGRVEDKALESAGLRRSEPTPVRLVWANGDFPIGPSKANLEVLRSCYKK